MIIVNQQPDTSSFAKNPIVWEFGTDYTTGPGGDLPENYVIKVKVSIEENWGSGTFSEVAELDVWLNADGVGYIDISGILDSELEESFNEPPIPDFGVAVPYQANNVRKYKVEYAERYGVPPETQSFTSSGDLLVMCGGISEEEAASIDWFSSRDETNSWMTWYPDGKNVLPDQPEYLGWYNFEDTNQNVNLVIEMYTENDLSVPVNSFAGQMYNADSKKTMIFPVGFEDLQLDGQPQGDDCIKYTIHVETFNGGVPGGTVMSPKRTFYVDRSYYENKRYLLYLNGYCLPEVLRLTGDKTKKLTVNRYLSNRVRDSSSTLLKGSVFQYDVEFKQPMIYRTGYYTHKEVLALQELLVYNQAFEIYPDGYIPILLVGKDYDLGTKTQVLNALEFEALRAIKKKEYSEEFALPLVCDETSWQHDDESCWETTYDLWKLPD